LCSNKGSATQICVGPRPAPRRRAATPRSRARAPSASAPDATPAEAARRPKSHAFPRSSPLPRHLDCPAPRASPPPRRTHAVHATDRRSIRGPAVRTPAEECRSTAASRPSSSRRHRRSFARHIKGARLLLAPAPPRHQAIRVATVELRPSLPSTVEQLPMPLP
jgi:hypothetical protein